MTVNFRLWQHGQVINLLPNAADAAGRASTAYVHLGNAEKAYLVCAVNQGNAATVQLSPLQATSSAGANSKAVPAVPIVSNLDTGTSDLLVSRTAAASYTTNAATTGKLVIFEVDPSVLDSANGFRYLGVSTGASNAGNVTSVLLIMIPIKDRQQTPPTTVGL